MRPLPGTACVVLLLAISATAEAQHCAPIYESYLSEISVKKSEETIRFRFEYMLQGGRGQNAYQAYVLAYLERDAARVPAPAPDDLIDPAAAVVLHTQRIQRNERGSFDLEFHIDGDELARKMIAHGRLTEKDRTEHGGWGVYQERVRIAVFVPFLEDRTYSVMDGLPEDRHECNYGGDRALLFQTLPYRMSIHFGIVRAASVPEGVFRIEINGEPVPGERR